MRITSVPAPFTTAPMLDRKLARSTICGSFAALWMQVVPDAETAVRISMESLYETLRQQVITWEGADASWQAAKKDRAALDQKYQLGMIGRLEYLQGELAYLQAESAKLSADISLQKAYEDYLWQVKGVSVGGTQNSGQN